MRAPNVAGLLFASSLMAAAMPALAQRGVPKDGFPTWEERMVQVYANRARSDPTGEPKACSSSTVQPPLVYSYDLNRAARFHASNLAALGKFQHDSPCTIVSDIAGKFAPLGTCDGSAACACEGGVASCNPTCTGWYSRVCMFGTCPSAENIAWGYGSPLGTHQGWMNSSGHCTNILGGHGALGVGVKGAVYAENFTWGTPAGTLIAGGHDPEKSGGTVSFLVNYYDTRGAPLQAELNLDGTCTTMTRQRGSDTNGTWAASVSVPGSTCRRYVFTFKDPSGATVVLPESGSYGVGDSTCPDWSATTPPANCGVPPNAPPTVATRAAASPSPVTGTSATLSVLGADDGGEPALTYTWAGTGPAAVTFGANGTNAAKSTVATFTRAGSYTLTATIKDAGNQTATSSVTVEVQAAASALKVTPSSATVRIGDSLQFAAPVTDQFGQPLAPQPSVAWSVSGGGTVDASGKFSAGSSAGGPFTLTASAGGKSATASVTVSLGSPPVISQQAQANPNPVTGSTTQLTVSATDDGGASALVYEWKSSGPAPVQLAPNGDNAARTTTATFSAAGDYVFTVTVRDVAGLTATSDLSVSVPAQYAKLDVSPASVAVRPGGSARFSARLVDQFGHAGSAATTWSVSGGGAIDGAGLFTAGGTAGGPFDAVASSSGMTGKASVTIDPAAKDLVAPTVALVTPAEGQEVRGDVLLQASASDDTGVARVEFFAGDERVGVANAEPWSVNWDSRTATGGPRVIRADAFDFDGNRASASAQVTVANDGSGGSPFGTVYGRMGCASTAGSASPFVGLGLVAMALVRRRRA